MHITTRHELTPTCTKLHIHVQYRNWISFYTCATPTAKFECLTDACPQILTHAQTKDGQRTLIHVQYMELHSAHADLCFPPRVFVLNSFQCWSITFAFANLIVPCAVYFKLAIHQEVVSSALFVLVIFSLLALGIPLCGGHSITANMDEARPIPSSSGISTKLQWKCQSYHRVNRPSTKEPGVGVF